MTSISVNYALKWQCKFAPQYKWSKCKKLFNTRTGRQIRKVLNGGSIGYWIAGDFYTIDKLRDSLELIPKQHCPF
jgi:hypothetical protein